MKPYKRFFVLVLLLAAAGLATAAVYADSLKWSQPPVLGGDFQPECFYGWDEASAYRQGPAIVADDWLCQGSQPVSDIHWWGSYKGWTGSEAPPDAPNAFHIAIWTDAPASAPGNFGHPGTLLQEWQVEREKANETPAGCDYHPSYANSPEACFKYDFHIPQAEWFYQAGGDTIYWLSIAAVYSGLIETPYPWGWTTRPLYYHDAAIKIFKPLTPTVGSEYVEGEAIHDYAGAAWDMAFELTSPDYDFGDAPERAVTIGYPTLLRSNGARHLISPGLYLGASVDAEMDGQPTDQADGDDFTPPTGLDDEDGVVFSSMLMPGQPAILDVTASAVGYLNAWVDFDANRSWLDAGEHVLSGTLLVTGVNHLSVPVPSWAASSTFARFRFSSAASLLPTGEAPDGEVEDYPLQFVTWGKWVNGEPWSQNLVVEVETSETITVVDVVTYPHPFQLNENWQLGHLVPVTYTLDPPDGGTVHIYPENSNMAWDVPFTPTQVMTLTKQFRVEPCTWLRTGLQERLGPVGGQQETRIVNISKRQPKLDIASTYEPEVYAGLPAAFTLVYSNAGGYENNVVITNTFPRLAPFESSDPPPTAQDPNGLWANWSVGDLPGGEGGSIDVTVTVASSLQPSTTIEVWDGIFNHVGELADEVTSTFHVRSPWDKWVNGKPWGPDLVYMVQTSDTITVADIFQPASSFTLNENWTPGELALITYTIEPTHVGTVTVDDDKGLLVWDVPITPTQVVTLTKVFRAEPCTWGRTVLYESVGPIGAQPDMRNVTISKWQPQLGIDSLYSPPVRAGQLAAFTLVYGNSGGFENAVWITNTFPATAPFVESQPPPDRQDDAGAWAAWRIGDMPNGAQGSIQVTVAITTGPPSPAISIWDGIYNHAGVVADEVTTTFRLSQWAKWINGQLWKPDFLVTVQTSDTIEIVDSFDPSAGDIDIYLVETWEADKLALIDYKLEGPEPGEVISDAGYLQWEATPQGVITLTKFFHVEPCTWTQTIINEMEGDPTGQGELRSVTIVKLAPDLQIAAEYAQEVYAGQQATFSLTYSNTGGYENGVVVTQTFSPRQALFVSSVPEPDALNQDGGWARWELGDLATNDWGSIVVTVGINAGLRTSTTVRIGDGIYNHAGELADAVDIALHVKNIYNSAGSGNWHDPATWGVGGVPTTTSDVTITAGTRVTVAGPASCNRLFIAPGAGLIILNPFSLTVESEVWNHGWLRMGRINSSPSPTITRGAAAVLQQPTSFAIQNADGSQTKYHGLVITPTAGSMGLITVTIKGNQTCSGLSGPVLRCYEITPETPTTATIAFYYQWFEAGGNVAPFAWHWNAGEGRWDGLNSTHGGSGDAMWVQATDVTQYSPFTLDDGIPTAVTLRGLGTLRPALLATLLAALAILSLAGWAATRGRRTRRAS